MSSSLILASIVLALASVLLRANDFMNGRKTRVVGSSLRLLVLGSFIPFLVFGSWKSFLLALFAWAVVVRPLAGRVGVYLAVWIHRASESGPHESWVGLPDKHFARPLIAREALRDGSRGDFSASMKSMNEIGLLRNQAMDIALGQPLIQRLMRNRNVNREEVMESLGALAAEGCAGFVMGHCLPESIAYYPRPFAVLLAVKAGEVELTTDQLATAMVAYFRTGRALPLF